MTGVRPPGSPTISWLSNFPELNVRTYVTLDDRPGVWFLSLDAHQPVAVWVARRTFHLPYFNARIDYHHSGGRIRYQSRRTQRGAAAANFSAEYQPAGEVFRAPPGTLDEWLISRYCLYAADPQGRVYRGEIDHHPWPLQPAEVVIRTNSMCRPFGIELPNDEPLLHYVSRLETQAWKLKPVDASHQPGC